MAPLAHARPAVGAFLRFGPILKLGFARGVCVLRVELRGVCAFCVWSCEVHGDIVCSIAVLKLGFTGVCVFIF